MKANYLKPYISRQALEKEVKKEMDQRYNEVFDEIVQDIGSQIMGNVLYILDVCYGFKEKRLKEFLKKCNEICETMDNFNAFGKKFSWTSVDNVKYIKDNYGIDINNEINFSRDKDKRRKNND